LTDREIGELLVVQARAFPARGYQLGRQSSATIQLAALYRCSGQGGELWAVSGAQAGGRRVGALAVLLLSCHAGPLELEPVTRLNTPPVDRLMAIPWGDMTRRYDRSRAWLRGVMDGWDGLPLAAAVRNQVGLSPTEGSHYRRGMRIGTDVWRVLAGEGLAG
jgi:hypothetical protein